MIFSDEDDGDLNNKLGTCAKSETIFVNYFFMFVVFPQIVS